MKYRGGWHQLAGQEGGFCVYDLCVCACACACACVKCQGRWYWLAGQDVGYGSVLRAFQYDCVSARTRTGCWQSCNSTQDIKHKHTVFCLHTVLLIAPPHFPAIVAGSCDAAQLNFSFYTVDHLQIYHMYSVHTAFFAGIVFFIKNGHARRMYTALATCIHTQYTQSSTCSFADDT